MAIPLTSNARTPSRSVIQQWWNSPNFGRENDPNSIINDTLNNGIRVLRYPLEEPKYFLEMGISKYQKTIDTQPIQGRVDANTAPTEDDITGTTGNYYTTRVQQVLNAELHIRLPLPMTLVDAHSVAFSERNWTLGSMWGGIANQDPLQEKFGYAANQLLTVFLEGPRFKRFQMTWRLSAESPEESLQIHRILNVLNNRMSPGLGLGGAIFTFPRVFHLAFYPNSQYMYKFKPAVLENLVVNYTPAGQAAFHRESPKTPYKGGFKGGGPGNTPEGLEVTMQFLELEYWARNDFIFSNDPSYPNGVRGNPGAEPTDEGNS